MSDGSQIEAVNWHDGNNMSIGWGNYSQKKGGLCLGGVDIIHRVSATANNAEYIPYYRRGDSIDVNMGTAGFVTTGSREIYFVVPLGKPVIGNPTVSVASINGLTLRQNSAYKCGSTGSSWTSPSRYGAAVVDSNAVRVTATWDYSTDAANNDTIGIYASIRITFS